MKERSLSMKQGRGLRLWNIRFDCLRARRPLLKPVLASLLYNADELIFKRSASSARVKRG